MVDGYDFVVDRCTAANCSSLILLCRIPLLPNLLNCSGSCERARRCRFGRCKVPGPPPSWSMRDETWHLLAAATFHPAPALRLWIIRCINRIPLPCLNILYWSDALNDEPLLLLLCQELVSKDWSSVWICDGRGVRSMDAQLDGMERRGIDDGCLASASEMFFLHVL